MYKGVIFDLDGTLIDTITDIGNSTNLALQDLGYPTHDLDAYKIMVGNGFRKLIERALPQGADEKTIDKGYERFVYHYDKHYMEMTKPYAGIHDLLRDLMAHDIKIAVNSNKRDDYTKALMQTLFSDIDFIEVLGQKEGIDPKPAPDGAIMIMKKMELTKDDVIFVGDTKVDITTGKNANLATIGCLWGFRDEAELKAAGADHIVKEPREIASIVYGR